MSVQATCLASYDTRYSADSVEWLHGDIDSVPSGADLGIFVCGTYQLINPITKEFIVPGEANPSPPQKCLDTEDSEKLNSDKAIRSGNIQVFKASTESPHLEPIQTVETAASLDLKWSFKKLNVSGVQANVLGQADAIGQLSLYSWSPSDNKLSLQTQSKFEHIEGGEKEVLALSLDWSNKLYESDPFIAVSFSDGTLGTLEVGSKSDETICCSTQQRWKCHDFEAWIAAVNYWCPTTVFSGGDDAKLKGWDLRMVSEACANPSWVNKSHMMGVCSIQANPHREHMIATGRWVFIKHKLV
ncbi:Diphthine methyltransferase [Entomophthora muscae]|uniref:Diphthine methyltransferase n=1 Tax=Entomophthora muscae TaxID=34485 RepID=A0ACC2SCT4_9FUNG|nr:Diphthine methyltransferase [Entomophthora muscae]